MVALLFLIESFSGFSKEFVSGAEESVRSASASSSLQRLQTFLCLVLK